MPQTFTKENFQKDQMTTFVYHDKVRLGTVDHVGDSHVCIKLPAEHPVYKTMYQSFRFDKMAKLS